MNPPQKLTPKPLASNKIKIYEVPNNFTTNNNSFWLQHKNTKRIHA